MHSPTYVSEMHHQTTVSWLPIFCRHAFKLKIKGCKHGGRLNRRHQLWELKFLWRSLIQRRILCPSLCSRWGLNETWNLMRVSKMDTVSVLAQFTGSSFSWQGNIKSNEHTVFHTAYINIQITEISALIASIRSYVAHADGWCCRGKGSFC